MNSIPSSADTGVPRSTRSIIGEPIDGILHTLLLIGGLVGLTASTVLTIENFSLATDSDYIPSCSLNPILDCGSVMSTAQASVFGFPNSLLGIAGFAIVVTTGAGLLAGARFARWYWIGMQFGVTAAVVFVHWLIVQSLYVVGALCPYCMVVWAVTVPIFWYVTLRNVRQGAFGASTRADALAAAGNHLIPVTAWFLLVAGLVIHRFYAYWSTLL